MGHLDEKLCGVVLPVDGFALDGLAAVGTEKDRGGVSRGLSGTHAENHVPGGLVDDFKAGNFPRRVIVNVTDYEFVIASGFPVPALFDGAFVRGYPDKGRCVKFA